MSDEHNNERYEALQNMAKGIDALLAANGLKHLEVVNMATGETFTRYYYGIDVTDNVFNIGFGPNDDEVCPCCAKKEGEHEA